MNGKKLACLALATLLALALVACGGATSETPAASSVAPSQGAASSEAQPEAGGGGKVVVYGLLAEQASMPGMWELVQEKLAGTYEIELIQVDMDNVDKVIRTGIASGSPADIYFKQAQYMRNYVDAGQALDLTPYLEENNNEWKSIFIEGVLSLGNYDGKFYNIPVTAVYSNFYYNEDALTEAGITLPKSWSWDEFLEACEEIKQKTDMYPYAICGLCNDFMFRNDIMSVGMDEGRLEAIAAGEVEAADPIFVNALHRTKELYDKNYWYPGEGAMTTTRDEVVAAFQQGKVAILGDVNAISPMVADGADFEIGVTEWPATGTKCVNLGGADGYFVPVNAPNVQGAIDVLKTFMEEDVQQLHADAGLSSPRAGMVSSDPLNTKLGEVSGIIYPNELMHISAKMTSYWQDVLIEEYCLGGNESDLLAEIDRLRLEAVG